MLRDKNKQIDLFDTVNPYFTQASMTTGCIFPRANPETVMPIFLTASVTRQIVQRTMTIIDHNVNVIDRTGIYIGTGSPERMHQMHEGALKVLDSGQAYNIQPHQATRLYPSIKRLQPSAC